MISVAAIEVVVGVMDTTGLGLKFAGLVENIGDQQLFLSLLVAMTGALILGMGMPMATPTATATVSASSLDARLGAPQVTLSSSAVGSRLLGLDHRRVELLLDVQEGLREAVGAVAQGG